MHPAGRSAPPNQETRHGQAGSRVESFGRAAFFGGSFDPPHLGHLAIARAARDAFRLDTVLFAPVGAQPLKPEGLAAGFEDRLAMTRLAIEGEPRFVISFADAPKALDGGLAPNYTIDTLEKLRSEAAPGCALYCLMGADSFFGLRRWRRAAEVPFAASLIVASRPGQPLEGFWNALPPGVALDSAPQNATNQSGVEVLAFRVVNSEGERAPLYVLPGLDVEISASEIRSQIRAQSRQADVDSPCAEPAAGRGALLPQSVCGYIRSHGLYR